MRQIKGKTVQLDINPKGRQESELERQDKEQAVERRMTKLERQIAWLVAKYGAEMPESLK